MSDSTLLPLLFSFFPLEMVILILCIIEKIWLVYNPNTSSRTYTCTSWLLSALALVVFSTLLSIFLPTEFAKNIIGTKYGATFLANAGLIILLVFKPVSVALAAVGFWQPLWKSKTNRFASFLKLIPGLLIMAALLGVPAAWVLYAFWPIGIFAIIPLMAISLALIFALSIAHIWLDKNTSLNGNKKNI